MTYTVADVLNRAAKRLRIIPGGDVLQAEDAADALAAYNSMMFAFSAAGLTLLDPDDEAYEHESQTAADDFPLADKHFDAVWAVLMEKLIGQFPVDASVVAGAANAIKDGWSRLYAAFLVIDEVEMPRSTTQLPTQTDKFWG